jgi:hypothetical protein
MKYTIGLHGWLLTRKTLRLESCFHDHAFLLFLGLSIFDLAIQICFCLPFIKYDLLLAIGSRGGSSGFVD